MSWTNLILLPYWYVSKLCKTINKPLLSTPVDQKAYEVWEEGVSPVVTKDPGL